MKNGTNVPAPGPETETFVHRTMPPPGRARCPSTTVGAKPTDLARAASIAAPVVRAAHMTSAGAGSFASERARPPPRTVEVAATPQQMVERGGHRPLLGRDGPDWQARRHGSHDRRPRRARSLVSH